MDFVPIAINIIEIAKDAFPEFFAEITDKEKEELTNSVGRGIQFGLQYPFSSTADQLALKVAVMREYQDFRLMVLDRMIGERKHNAERVLMFIGKSVAVVAAAIPLAVAVVGSAAEGVTE